MSNMRLVVPHVPLYLSHFYPYGLIYILKNLSSLKIPYLSTCCCLDIYTNQFYVDNIAFAYYGNNEQQKKSYNSVSTAMLR